MITEPTVTLWACTQLVFDEGRNDHETDDLSGLTGGLFDVLPPLPGTKEAHAADYLAEGAGRACYQSWHRPNPKTAANEDYLDHIREVGHYSVLSHASVTFYIEGVSRSLTHELIRSRFLAFSQLSQRYVDSSDLDWVAPPILLDEPDMLEILDNSFRNAVRTYENLTERIESKGRQESPSGTMVRKRAREAARAVLPNDTETKIVVSGNLRAWRDFLTQRWTVHADLEIQRLAGILVSQLMQLAPGTFADFDPTTPGA